MARWKSAPADKRTDDHMTALCNHICRADTPPEDVTTKVPDLWSQGVPVERREATLALEKDVIVGESR